MLKHMVMFKAKPGTDEVTIREMMARLEQLVGQVPGLVAARCYRALPSDRPVAYTFLLDSTLESQADLQPYMTHPAHVAAVEWLNPHLENRAVVDYEEMTR